MTLAGPICFSARVVGRRYAALAKRLEPFSAQLIGLGCVSLFPMGLGALSVPMFKIYVGNLDPRVKIEHVRELFSPFAVIEDAVLATDAKTGKAKGFAIVMVRDAEIGRAAVKATQGKRLMGKTLTINEVVKKGKGVAAPAPAVRQGPFGPHFNKQGGGRFGSTGGGSRLGGSARRGMNRGLRGPGPGVGPGAGPGTGFGSGTARPSFGAGAAPAGPADRIGPRGAGDGPRSPLGGAGSSVRSPLDGRPSDGHPPKRDGLERPPADGASS